MAFHIYATQYGMAALGVVTKKGLYNGTFFDNQFNNGNDKIDSRQCTK